MHFSYSLSAAFAILNHARIESIVNCDFHYWYTSSTQLIWWTLIQDIVSLEFNQFKYAAITHSIAPPFHFINIMAPVHLELSISTCTSIAETNWNHIHDLNPQGHYCSAAKYHYTTDILRYRVRLPRLLLANWHSHSILYRKIYDFQLKWALGLPEPIERALGIEKSWKIAFFHGFSMAGGHFSNWRPEIQFWGPKIAFRGHFFNSGPRIGKTGSRDRKMAIFYCPGTGFWNKLIFRGSNLASKPSAQGVPQFVPDRKSSFPDHLSTGFRS